MAQFENGIMKHVKQINVIVIAVLLLILLLISFMSPGILESRILAAKFKPLIQGAGRVCIFMLYAMTIVLVVNYIYYGLLQLSRRNVYTDEQREDLIEVLRQPDARADIRVFREKTKKLTEMRNSLSEIIAAMLPNALKQQFMLEQYFRTKIENHMNRFSGALNTITTITGLGPIIGFLGTLLGLVLAFAVSADAIRTEGHMSPDTFGELQYSMMIAIMTSVFGVMVKIFGSVVRQAILSKINKIQDEISSIPTESMYSE